MEHEHGSEGTYVVAHRGNEITNWRTTDGAATRDAAVEHPPGTLLVNGKEYQLAQRLEAWRSAGLLSEEKYRERILSSGRIMTLREINNAHRLKLTSTKSVRDHDVDDTPIRTLHDINVRHHAAFPTTSPSNLSVTSPTSENGRQS
jgi:hypothetical protein